MLRLLVGRFESIDNGLFALASMGIGITTSIGSLLPFAVPFLSSEVSKHESYGLAFPPVVARLTGLPADDLLVFSCSDCLALQDQALSLRENLQTKKQELKARIEDELTSFDAGKRRFLLRIKRDCHNDRSLRKHFARQEWSCLETISSELCDELQTLEAEWHTVSSHLDDRYASSLQLEREHVLSLVDNKGLVRAIALGSPGLIDKIRKGAARSGPVSRKIPKWETSFLRFVVRAGAKLSPNSTLTTYSMGGIEELETSESLRFVGSDFMERSLVRADRPEMEQLISLLTRYTKIREKFLVGWNESVAEAEAGKYRFVRNRIWNLNPDGEGFVWEPAVRIKLRLDSAWVEGLQSELAAGPIPFEELCHKLVDSYSVNLEVDAEWSVRSEIHRLAEIGFLHLLPPWPSQQEKLEVSIRSFLGQADLEHPKVEQIRVHLDRVLELEEEFAVSPRPEACLRELESGFLRLLRAALPEDHESHPLAPARFYEDVSLQAPDNEPKPILQLSKTKVDELYQSIDAVSRLVGVFNTRNDGLHTLAAWWREHQPNQKFLPFLDVVRGFSKTWKKYSPFVKGASQGVLQTFNPLGSETLNRLFEERKELLNQTGAAVLASPGQDRIDASEIYRILPAHLDRYRPALGCSVLVQPTDSAGETWVLNQIHEGTGRYLSRFTPVLQGATRKSLLNRLMARSTVLVDNEEADLLQVTDPHGFLTSATPIQAYKALEVRGSYLGLPPERRVTLKDLTIHIDLETESFRLVDASGRRLIPVHLSSRRDIGLAPILHFLLLFGPGETRGVFPFQVYKEDHGIRCYNRLSCGPLVLHRRRWDVDLEDLRHRLAGASDLEAFKRLHSWRRGVRVPNIGYYREETYNGGLKPQFVDFSSPSLCRLFVLSVLKSQQKFMRFEEALPSPKDYPQDHLEKHRGLEVLIERLAISA